MSATILSHLVHFPRFTGVQFLLLLCWVCLSGSVCPLSLSLLPSPPYHPLLGISPHHAICALWGPCGLLSFLVSVHVCQAGPTLRVGPCFCSPPKSTSQGSWPSCLVSSQLPCPCPGLFGFWVSSTHRYSKRVPPALRSLYLPSPEIPLLPFHGTGIAGLRTCAWLYYSLGNFSSCLCSKHLSVHPSSGCASY